MANNSSDVVNKIMRYKLQLTNTQEANKILKILKKLKNLEITLDVLAETGIGKTVNTFRRHELAGNLAKSLVQDWKKLVPKESKSPTTDDIVTDDQPCKEKLSSHVHGAKDDLNKNCLNDEKEGKETVNKKMKKEDFSFCGGTDQQRNQHNSTHDYLNKSKVTEKEKNVVFEQCGKGSRDKNRIKSQKLEDFLTKTKSRKRKKYNRFSDESDNSDADCDKKPLKENKSKGQLCPESSSQKSKEEESEAKHSEAKIKKKKKRSGHKGKEKSPGSLSESQNIKQDIEDGNSGTEEPAMSFESYLNYDENVCKRKERPKPKKRLPKPKIPAVNKAPVQAVNTEPEEEPKKPLAATPCPDSPFEGTVEPVVKIPESPPLESWFPEVTSHHRKADKESDSCDIMDESAIFTCQRLNKKMQVYSGAKTIFLPTMMSLYQQCIRTLQNNINLLYETGGVPFEILEPVLERCTPEQLLRIEEYNPIYIGETDHLWGKHCQRDFKDAKLQEYESWKEMYLRMSDERERKFKMITKTIVSAQSSKPKGRQVKMAFIHSVAKPPRDVRIKQEIHGTAVQQPQPKCSVKIQDSKPRQAPKEPSSRSSSSTTSTTSNSLDSRKKTKVAPMMAKSLKTLKQFGRR